MSEGAEPEQGRILLVEDDLDYRVVLERQLARAGHTVHAVMTAEAALLAVAEFVPDVVLLDYCLPTSDGLEVCRRIREHHALLPVILLSGHTTLDLTAAAVEAGVSDFLDKDAPRQMLLLRIRAALRTKRLADLAARRYDELRYLSDLAARVGGMLRADDIRLAAAEALARFEPLGLYVVDLLEGERVEARSFGASPLERDLPMLGVVLAQAGEALGVTLRPEAIQYAHVPLEWSRRPGTELVGRALAAGGRPRTWMALAPARTLDPDELRVLDAALDRLATPLENAHLYETVQRAHADVSRMMKELRRTQTTLVQHEKMASIGQLAAGVAHEINNPLAFVISNLNVLREYARDLAVLLGLAGREAAASARNRPNAPQADPAFLMADLDSLIAESLEGANRVHRIVRDLKNFSHSSGSGQFEEVDLQATLESTLNILHGEIKNRAVVHRDLRPVPAVRGDRGKLGQVFLNLVLNAAHAIAPDREGRIAVRLFSAGANVAVQIEDNGAGIAPEVRPRIFEPFFTTKEMGVGTGLGLAIADDIVRLHGGRIHVDSEVGKGSVFTVLLPARNTVPIPSIFVEPGPPDEPTGLAVFIDDERLLLNAFRRAFSRMVRVRLAHGGEEGIRLLSELRDVDVVFCDLLMPRIGGIEVYDWVRANRPDLLDRFVIITGGHLDDRTRDFVEQTDVPVVHKPFSVGEVAQLITRFTGRRSAGG